MKTAASIFNAAFIAGLYMKDATLSTNGASRTMLRTRRFFIGRIAFMKPTLLTLGVAAAVTLTFAGIQAQGPGDRPAARPNATRSVALRPNGVRPTTPPLASA